MIARVHVAALALLASACGYRPVHDAEAPRLHVVLVRAQAADAVTNDEVLGGLREGLAREGALAAGSGYPRVELEVLRTDESSEGIAAVRPRPGEAEVPRARGTDVGVVARAWVVRAVGGPREDDTGDMRATSLVATPAADVGGSLSGESLRHDDALRATAHRLGARVALRVLGHPVSKDELVGQSDQSE